MLFTLQRVSNCFVLSTIKRFVQGAARMQVFTQKRNPLTGSTEWDMQPEDYDYHQEIARSAFADMLHDTERNRKYNQALKLAIDKMHKAGKKANVLDIGTGTGLLSIMAARAGADSIVACEAFKPMAECCSKILEQNGVADKINLIPKRSTELTVGEDGDIKEKANILVTEVFDTELIGEGALPTFTHAHKYLLDTDCIVVPDSAVVYAQLVECYPLNTCHRMDDLKDENNEVVLKTPPKIRNCAGSPAVLDVQLSQLPRHKFIELSEVLPIFYYNWSGRVPVDNKKVVKQTLYATGSGKAHVVFAWWELNMDTEGKIVLSCAPWWHHPDTDTASKRPQDTIPWRDHWMQGVYFLPKQMKIKQYSENTLVCCQDEYSFWFYLENEESKYQSYERPVCECGVHMAFSRTHLSYLNDKTRSNRFLSEVKLAIDEARDPVVLDLSGGSIRGLASAKLGAKKVYILETNNLHLGILKDYIQENDIQNAEFISEITDDILKEVTTIVCDPNIASAILPWENLKMAYTLFRHRSKLRVDVTIIPSKCQFWAVPVQFRDMHKIRVPLGVCEGVNMSIFDELVENSRIISDAEIEAQPMWEYTAYCGGQQRLLLEIEMDKLKCTYANNDTIQIVTEQNWCELPEDVTINGFVLWAVFKIGNKCISSGVQGVHNVGEVLQFDPCTRQAVKILKSPYKMKCTDKWSFQIACDLDNGQFNANFDLILPDPEETQNETARSPLLDMVLLQREAFPVIATLSRRVGDRIMLVKYAEERCCPFPVPQSLSRLLRHPWEEMRVIQQRGGYKKSIRFKLKISSKPYRAFNKICNRRPD